MSSELQDFHLPTPIPCVDKESAWEIDCQDIESTSEAAANVAILTIGALGAAFFYHLTRGSKIKHNRVYFVRRRSSAHNAALLEYGTFAVAAEQSLRKHSVKDFFRPDLLACCDEGWLPKVLLVCTQPDQLESTVGDYVAMLERLYSTHGIDIAVARLPVLVLCSNGIYHERMRRFLVESL